MGNFQREFICLSHQTFGVLLFTLENQNQQAKRNSTEFWNICLKVNKPMKKQKKTIKEKVIETAKKYNIKLPERLTSDVLIDILPATMEFKVKNWWKEPPYITKEVEFFLKKEADSANGTYYYWVGYQWWQSDDNYVELEADGETLLEALANLFIKVAKMKKLTKTYD